MLMYNAAFTYHTHSIMCHSYSISVACGNLEAAKWLKLDQDNAILILRKFLTYKYWWWQCHICWDSLNYKATWYTQEMAPQSMELSTKLMIMRGKKSSEVVIYIWKWMNLAWFIDTICAGRRENIIQLLWYFVMWEQPLLSELVHVFAVMFKLG